MIFDPAVSDARFREVVEAGTVFFARSIQPFERGRPWLRRTRALWGLNGGEEQRGGELDLRGGAERTT